MSGGAGGGTGGGACSACLSAGRALRGLRALAPLYAALLQARDVCASYEHVSVCWECAALLRRVAEFQRRAQHARRVLTAGSAAECISTSALTVTTRNTIDYTYEHIEEPEWKIPAVKCETHLKLEHLSDESDPAKEFLSYQSLDQVPKQQNISASFELNSDTKIKRRRLHNATRDTKISKIKNKVTISPEDRASLSSYDTIRLSEEEMILYIKKCKTKDTYLAAVFRCEGCVLIFDSDVLLREHSTAYHTQIGDRLPCDICQVYVPDDTMATHREGHYTHYKCVQCGHTENTEGAIRSHVSQPHKTALKCKVCDIQFSTIKKLRYHKGTVHSDPVKCDVCHREFKYKPYLDQHMLTIKKLRYHKGTVHSDPVKCDVCHREFKYKPYLDQHMLQHTGGPPRLPCPTCGKLYAGKHGLQIHMKLHPRGGEDAEGRGVRCAGCDVEFATEYQLYAHLRNSLRHQGRLRHECAECSKKFMTEQELKAHVDYRHLGLLMFKCKICNKDLGSRNGLSKHVKSVHEGREMPRKCVCETCGQTFKRNRELNQHRLIHTGERPFTCDVCGATFRQAPAMYTHKRLVHLKIKRGKKS